MPWRTEDLALRVVLARQPDRGRVGSIAHEPHGGEYMVGRTWRRFGYLEHNEKTALCVLHCSFRVFVVPENVLGVVGHRKLTGETAGLLVLL